MDLPELLNIDKDRLMEASKSRMSAYSSSMDRGAKSRSRSISKSTKKKEPVSVGYSRDISDTEEDNKAYPKLDQIEFKKKHSQKYARKTIANNA